MSGSYAVWAEDGRWRCPACKVTLDPCDYGHIRSPCWGCGLTILEPQVYKEHQALLKGDPNAHWPPPETP
jgi:hypothetical protein